MSRRSSEPQLTPDLVMSAYAIGAFPMDEHGILRWYSPDPRGIIPLEGYTASRSLRRRVRRGDFEIRVNTAFTEVIAACAVREDGTWISKRLMQVYIELHAQGCAHSVESWAGGSLMGGLYGVSLGAAFFGESMFHRATDASKVALVALVDRLRDRGFTLLDTQWTTPHLEQFGATTIPRSEYITMLSDAIGRPVRFYP
jgi:leucyl/phenylalanyl-tRNA--protein transferase